ncbi:MAG: hypothetical protein HYR55_03640 [Acidobacteria bacterium]|nr:hypothetical protein [Acidobacteriota bacterium]
MKKEVFILGILAMLTSVTTFGGVVCETIVGCTVLDKFFEGAPQPAIQFDSEIDQIVHFGIELHLGFGCNDLLTSIALDVVLPAGHHNFFIRFQPPLDEGTEISMKWWPDPWCEAPLCVDYAIGLKPPVCDGSQSNTHEEFLEF